jgi:hypothetical protein
MAEDFLSLVTSKAWRAELAGLFLGKLSSAELEGRTENEQLVLRWIVNRDPYAGAEYYAKKNSPLLPVSIARAILEDRKRKKGGRHSNSKEWAKQKASDAACFLAMEHLRESDPGLSQTAAGDRVGRLMNLSCPAVVRAWKKEMQLLSNPPKTHP